MRLVALARSLWRNLVRRHGAEQALDDELRAYVELLAEEHARDGMPLERARRAALLETGGVEQVKEMTRDAWVGNALATGARELRYAMRSLRRAPAFVVIAVTTLALGIGGATAVFTLMKASLLHALPGVAEPDRLVTVDAHVHGSQQVDEFSYADYRDLREHAPALAGLAAYNGAPMAVTDAAGATRTMAGFVSDNFFTVLGVRPVTGRFFSAGTAAAGASSTENQQVVVLSYEWWQQRFGGAANAIGSTLRLDGHPFTIIGVAPPGFTGAFTMYPMTLWTPAIANDRVSPPIAAYDMNLRSRASRWFFLVGRLAPGQTIEHAQRDLAATTRWLAATYPADKDRTVQVLSGAGMDANERATASRLPRLLGVAVALLLLIACGNVASLSLVRAAARRRELAMRLALGASRAALVRHVAVEGVVLATGAGVLGILLARWLVSSSALVHSVVSIPGMDVGMDVRVLAVALGTTVLTAILVSLVPAVQILRVPPGAVLKEGGGAVRRRSAGGQRTLVAAQVGASLVLLSAAAVIFSAFHRVLTAHDEIDPQGLTDVSLRVVSSIHDTTRQVAFYRAVLARATAEPSIAGATLTNTVPPLEWGSRATVFRRGEEPPPGTLAEHGRDLGLRVDALEISPRFFDVMRIPVVRGRAFTASDNEQSAPVVIVSRRVADALWPGQDPIGRFLSVPSAKGPPRPPLRVVGVAADTRNVALTSVALAMYVPFAQHPGSNLSLVVRGRGSLPVPMTTVRRLVAEVDAGVAVEGGKTLLEELQAQLRPQQAASAWIGAFGIIALLLAAIGLYGVVAQGVLQRTRELAVRSALGASPGGILRTVLGDGLRLVAMGGVAGALGAMAAFRVLQSLFTAVAPADLRAVVVAAAALALAMLAATILPARRAAKLNLVDALRSD
ncbi:MAG TPA: ADOP family duplicated permease [Gemmatimonadaceae bacterium]|nr:ADOP family duplicated permease [Gemmatimonadaceae bacterium]